MVIFYSYVSLPEGNLIIETTTLGFSVLFEVDFQHWGEGTIEFRDALHR